METFQFPSRNELRGLVTKVWPEKGHKPLVDQVLNYAECEIAAVGLPGYLGFAVESYCAERSNRMRSACYASMAPLIRILVVDKEARNLALNEYVSMLERLSCFEH